MYLSNLRLLITVLTILTFTFHPFFLSLSVAQLHQTQSKIDAWTSDCWLPDKWKNEKKCVCTLKTNYDFFRHSDLVISDDRFAEVNKMMFQDLAAYIPEVITLTISQEKEGLRLSIDGTGEMLATMGNKRVQDWKLQNPYSFQEVLAYQIPIYKKVGIRIDEDDPLYSDMCDNNMCYFDSEYTMSLLKRFISSKSASIRLFPNTNYIEGGVFEKVVPLQGFHDAFKEAFDYNLSSKSIIKSPDVSGQSNSIKKRCTGKQIDRMIKAGFSKEEIMRLCGE